MPATNTSRAPSSQPNAIRLSPHATASSVADASRNAWRVFLEQSEGWGKAELVLWCGGLYLPITRQADGFSASDDADSDDDYHSVDPHFVERMIDIARTQAMRVLSSFALPRARLLFSRMMKDEGAVTCFQDGTGAVGFVPTPATDSLVDRLLSLIAADLFARPGDFESEVICDGCDGIVMGPTACCSSDDGRQSGVVVKQLDTLIVPLAS